MKKRKKKILALAMAFSLLFSGSQVGNTLANYDDNENVVIEQEQDTSEEDIEILNIETEEPSEDVNETVEEVSEEIIEEVPSVDYSAILGISNYTSLSKEQKIDLIEDIFNNSEKLSALVSLSDEDVFTIFSISSREDFNKEMKEIILNEDFNKDLINNLLNCEAIEIYNLIGLTRDELCDSIAEVPDDAVVGIVEEEPTTEEVVTIEEEVNEEFNPEDIPDEMYEQFFDIIEGMSDEELEEFLANNPVYNYIYQQLFQQVMLLANPTIPSYSFWLDGYRYTMDRVNGEMPAFGHTIDYYDRYWICCKPNENSPFAFTASNIGNTPYTGTWSASGTQLQNARAVYYEYYQGGSPYSGNTPPEDLSKALEKAVYGTTFTYGNASLSASTQSTDYAPYVSDFKVTKLTSGTWQSISGAKIKTTISGNVQKTEEMRFETNSRFIDCSVTIPANMTFYYKTPSSSTYSSKSGGTSGSSIAVPNGTLGYFTAPNTYNGLSSITVKSARHDNSSEDGWYLTDVCVAKPNYTTYKSDGVTRIWTQDLISIGGEKASVSFQVEGQALCSIGVKKVSSNPSITNGNANYSLSGATFGVYTNASATGSPIATITTGKAMNYTNSNTTNISGDVAILYNLPIPSGNKYYLKELSSGAGYKVNSTIISVTVDTSNSTNPNTIANMGTCSEPPTTVFVKVTKESADPSITLGNDCYSLNGAEFKVYKTYSDASNKTNDVATLTTNASGITNTAELPIIAGNKYYIRETKASKGFIINPNIFTVDVGGATTVANAVNQTVKETPGFDPFEIVTKKVVKDLHGNIVESRPIEGVVFEVKYYSNSTVDGDPDAKWHFVTNDEGRIYYRDTYLDSSYTENSPLYTAPSGSYQLPFGLVTVQEVSTPDAYILDTTINEFLIDENTASLPQITREHNVTIGNTPKSRPFSIKKLADNHGGSALPLANAGFKACKVDYLPTDANGNYVWDDAIANANPVEISTATSNVPYHGTTVNTDNTVLWTDANGDATSVRLEYGTYLIHEAYVPTNYLACDDFLITVDENTDVPLGVFYRIDKDWMSYLKIVKVDEDSSLTILNNHSKFKIWSYDTNSYVKTKAVVNGSLTTITEFETDDNGVVMTYEPLPCGDYRVEEIVEPTGYYEKDTTISHDITITNIGVYEPYYDEDGALTSYGIMTVTVPNKAINGKIRVEKLGELLEYDSATDKFSIATEHLPMVEFEVYAKEDIYSADGQNTLIYSKDELVDIMVTDIDGIAESVFLPLGNYYLKETTSIPDYKPHEDVNVELSLDGELETSTDGNIITKTIVADAEVTNSAYIPTITTLSLDADSKTHTGQIGETCNIIETVSYENLICDGRTYTATATAMLDDGTPFEQDGKPVTMSKDFEPTSPFDTIDFEFTIDSTELKGRSLVFFETLECNSKVVATEYELDNEEQTIHFLDVKTQARDEITLDNIGSIDSKVIYDDCSVFNTVVGESYTIIGYVYDKETGKPLKYNGTDVTTKKTFVSTKKDDVIRVEFEVNASLLKGKDVVCFEYLYQNDVCLAIHASLEDTDETISYPDLHTNATDGVTLDHYGAVHNIVRVNDEVFCHNLILDKSYTIVGVLMNKATGKPILDLDGNEITSTVTFVAKEKNPIIIVPFEVDSEVLKGKTTVVFESLRTSDVEICYHNNLNDEDQTVAYPSISTTATSKESGDHYGQKLKEFTLIDTIEFENVKPEMEMEIVGVLYSKATKEPLLIDGEKVTSTIKYTPVSETGTVDMNFTFDSSEVKGEVVVFEYCYIKDANGKTILYCEHADLNSAEQTIKFPGTPKTGDTFPIKNIFIFLGCAIIGSVGCIIYTRRKSKKLD